MTRQLASLLFIAAITILAKPCYTAYTLPTTCDIPWENSHHGLCILNKAWSVAPTNTKSLDPNPVAVPAGSCINSAHKYMNVYGLLLAANMGTQKLPDGSLCWIGKAYQEMFPVANGQNGCDSYNQHLILQKSFEYRAASPVWYKKQGANPVKLDENFSACDIISVAKNGATGGQIIEVIEHLLHAVSDVGFTKAMPCYFSPDKKKKSLLNYAMEEAIKNKVYVVTSYDKMKSASLEIRHRIKIQEYFYWLVTTAWGYQDLYGKKEAEWAVTTWSKLAACDKNPIGVDLYNNVISKIISKPSLATITALGKLMKGSTPDASPCPLTEGTTGSKCCCTCSGGCVKDDVQDGTLATCNKVGCNAQKPFTWTKVCPTTTVTNLTSCSAKAVPIQRKSTLKKPTKAVLPSDIVWAKPHHHKPKEHHHEDKEHHHEHKEHHHEHKEEHHEESEEHLEETSEEHEEEMYSLF